MKGKNVILFSGGVSSAIAAIETVRRHGKENVLILNHDLSSKIENKDVKRFKREVADYLGIPITYANCEDVENMTPLKVCKSKGAFSGDGTTKTALCTHYLKTKPFHKWLKENYPVSEGEVRDDVTMIYGFDSNETERIQRRTGIMLTKGYKTDYPLALWKRTIRDTSEIGIEKPRTYKIFKHANCIGCLKAGRQHWYVVYCLRPDIFFEAVEAEAEIGYSIIKDTYLIDLIPKFESMKKRGICPNDKDDSQSFWNMVDKVLPEQLTMFNIPCDCALL